MTITISELPSTPGVGPLDLIAVEQTVAGVTTTSKATINQLSVATTSVSVATSNGFAGASSGGTSSTLVLKTTVTGILKGNGTAISAAAPSDFPILNQNTTGSAATAAVVTTAAQPAITSVGTVTGLLSSGLVQTRQIYVDSGIVGQDIPPGASGPGSITADTFITVRADLYPNYFQIGTFDAFSRYEIHSEMPNTVLRLGGWQSDGDANNTSAQGIVVYGTGLLGAFTGSSGAYARTKSDRFGLYAVESTLPYYTAGAYWWRVDGTEFYYKDNIGTNLIHIDRTTGAVTMSGALTVTGSIVGTTTRNAVVYDRLGTISDAAIYNGTIGINGTTGIQITLPVAYSNANFKVQLTYSGSVFTPGNAGTLYATVNNAQHFTIYSTNVADTNNVFWHTTGSVNV